nr:39K [Calliteara abietis nucleopolyhedrovirus]
MVNQAQNCVEILEKYENSPLNKSNNDINAAKIKLFEKKKMPYRFVVIEVHNYDKKIMKRGKKIIVNNKYILFNSWYTKNRKSNWFSSHDMWNYMKSHEVCSQFIDIFDYIEKLGKSLKVSATAAASSIAAASNLADDDNQATLLTETGGDETQQKLLSSSSSSRKKKHELDVDQIKENNDRRLKLYDEFYRVLTVTFETNSPPASSSIYDHKLTRAFIETGMRAFKNVVNSLEYERQQQQQQQQQQQHTQQQQKYANKLTMFANKASVAGGGANASFNSGNGAAGAAVVNDSYSTDTYVVSAEKGASRKRKHSGANAKKHAKQKRSAVSSSDDYAMVSDVLEDSQMSE